MHQLTDSAAWQTPVKPERLRAGDKVAVVSPSWGGPGTFPHRYQAGKRQMEQALDVKVIEMPHALKNADWVAANPKARADDIMQAFADPSVKGIVASIGGDDSVRLIPHLDLSLIAANPKVFLGFSDTTTLHFACMKAGLVSFYGPSVMAGFGENGGPFEYAMRSVRKAVASSCIIGPVEPNRDGWTVQHLDWADPANQETRRMLSPSAGPVVLQGSGKVCGRLIGGCAEVMDMLNGSPWWPPAYLWKNSILFYETSEDAPAPAFVRYWMRNLAAQGILRNVNGILLARPGGHQMPVEQHAAYGKEIVNVLREEGLENTPVIANMDFGHTDPAFTLPYGVEAEIDASTGRLTILEAAVSDGPPTVVAEARPR